MFQPGWHRPFAERRTSFTELDGTLRFVLMDGTEVHRIGPPPEVYDYNTGKLIGWMGPRGARASRARAAMRELQ